VAALMLSAQGALSGAELRSLLKATAVDTALSASEEGAGILNAAAAVAAALGGPPPPVNSVPVASFTFSCSGLSCAFDASASSDADGDVLSYSWDFGDGSPGAGVAPSHVYAGAGVYSVVLTVGDGQASDEASQSVAVSDGSPAPISLEAAGYKVKGQHHVDLSWSGATSAQVDIYRNGALRSTTSNDGFHTDAIGARGSATYVYRVCEAGTAICSSDKTVAF